MGKQLCLAVTILMITLPLVATADPPQPPGTPPYGHRKGAEMREKIHTMKIWKMTEELNLTEAQAAKFFPLLNEFEAQLEDIREEEKGLMDQLAKLVWNKDADSGEIDVVIDKLEQLEDREGNLKVAFRKKAQGTLSTAQVGRMILFNRHFPRVMQDMMREMEQRGPDAGPGVRTPGR